MMLDVLGLNPDSDGWGRLLLEMSLLFLKTFLGGGKLYSIQQWTSLPSIAENQPETEARGK